MPKINTDKEKIQALLERGVANIYPQPAFLAKLLNSGRRLSVYLGIDPTGPTLHLGHAINLEKLRLFQELGHQVILLVGDLTATIGDPTDKKSTRQPLSAKQVLQNAKDYTKQAAKILSFSGNNKVVVKYNSQWLAKMKLSDMMSPAGNFTVGQLMERDMFQERIKADKPISLQEFFYPVLQAYDSVAMDVDGELGGNDQTFNMLAGRDLLKALKNKEKFVLTMKLLTDSGGTKMGKTEGNMVSLSDSPTDMFGKIMSWTDEMILPGFELCTTVPMADIAAMKKDLARGANPRQFKAALAYQVVCKYHGVTAAKKANEEFTKVFAQGGKPDKIEVFAIKTGAINPADLLVAMKLSASKNEARRLIDGGGLKINDQKISDWKNNLTIKSGDIIQAGKRKFGQIK